MVTNTVTLLYFVFHDPATTEIYTLSLHDALPISAAPSSPSPASARRRPPARKPPPGRARRTGPPAPRGCSRRARRPRARSEEHTSELQSHSDLVCRLLLEKKNNKHTAKNSTHSQN